MRDTGGLDPQLQKEAKLRAQRARSYAEKFPHLSSPDDPWCKVAWQYDRLARFDKGAR